MQGEQVPLADLLVTYCYERDVTCPNCSYSLRNSTTPRCPECGAELLLHIHPRVGAAPISSTIGLIGVVVGLILCIVAILGSFTRGWGAIGVSVALFVLTVVQLSLWDTYFRKVRRKDRAKLPVYIASGWAMPVIIILRWVLKF